MLWIALAPGAAPPPPNSFPPEPVAPTLGKGMSARSPEKAQASWDMAPEAGDLQALSWWALQFSPRVCVLEQAVLLEAQASVRLFGGQRALLARLRQEGVAFGLAGLAVAPTALAALALLHQLRPEGAMAQDSMVQAAAVAAEDRPARSATGCTVRRLAVTLDALPLSALSAVAAHGATLARLGCRTLGQLRRLPRGGLARRFGAPLLAALDQAYGEVPESYPWVELPECFDVGLEFTGRVEQAAGLLFGAQRLLQQLAAWLLARQCGVTGVALHWEHDLQRRSEAGQGRLEVRSAAATRDVAHLARLLAEHLARTTLAAPVVAIRLEACGVEPLPTASGSLLPDERALGESWPQLVERLSARLGPQRVLVGELRADHRPQHMQAWQPAARGLAVARGRRVALPGSVAQQPPWLLARPLRLAVRQDRPLYHGPLTLLAGPQRIEVGWWGAAEADEAEGPEAAEPTLRDYFIAESAEAGLLWIYRQRGGAEVGWYLHGLYG